MTSWIASPTTTPCGPGWRRRGRRHAARDAWPAEDRARRQRAARLRPYRLGRHGRPGVAGRGVARERRWPRPRDGRGGRPVRADRSAPGGAVPRRPCWPWGALSSPRPGPTGAEAWRAALADGGAVRSAWPTAAGALDGADHGDGGATRGRRSGRTWTRLVGRTWPWWWRRTPSSPSTWWPKAARRPPGHGSHPGARCRRAGRPPALRLGGAEADRDAARPGGHGHGAEMLGAADHVLS